MALELTMKRQKKSVYPTKTTINLMPGNQMTKNAGRDIALFIIGLVLIGLFMKFGVIDVLTDAARSTGKLATAQAQLAELEQENSDYSALQAEYAKYAQTGLTDEEQTYANRGQILSLLGTTVESTASLQSVTVKGNTISLQFTNTSLEDVSKVVASLESSPIVSSVSMSTAKTDKTGDVVSTVTVTLVSATSTVATTEGSVG